MFKRDCCNLYLYFFHFIFDINKVYYIMYLKKIICLDDKNNL